MKRALFLVLLILILSSCVQQEANSNMNPSNTNSSAKQQEGIIVEIEENEDGWKRILIISEINKEDISNKKPKKLISMAQKKDSEYAYYSVKPGKYENLEIGAHIIVHWSGIENFSDPPGRGADKIDIVSNK